jgi:hypothetical protein
VTDNIHSIDEKRPDRRGNGWQPATPQQAVALLTSCLALVRPVGMPESEAEDWLAVALSEVSAYPADVLAIGASEARRTATHHAQIVPTICRECDPIMATRQRLARLPKIPRDDTPRLPAPKLTQDDVGRLSPMLVKIGLGCGALEMDDSGNVVPVNG